MTALNWPKRVWYRNDRGFWASREPTREDRERRRDVERDRPTCPKAWEWRSATGGE